MGAPTVSVALNTNTEGAPQWGTVLAGGTICFTGPDTTTTSLDPVTAPAAGCKVADECWYSTGGGSYVLCTTYTGTVNTNQYVMKVTFGGSPTASAPILTYYDSTSHGADPDDQMAQGTSDTNDTGFLKGVETTDGAPAAAWCVNTTGTAGASTINCLDGDQRYVQCAATAAADGSKYYNIVAFCPSDATAGAAGHDGVISQKYTYT